MNISSVDAAEIRARQRVARYGEAGAFVEVGDVLIVHVPIRTVSEMNAREHHHARHRRHKAQYNAVAACWGFLARAWVRDNRPPYTVTMTRVAPRALDSDNLSASFKACRDQVARHLGIDDGSPLVRWTYDQRKGLPKQYAVEIKIERAA